MNDLPSNIDKRALRDAAEKALISRARLTLMESVFDDEGEVSPETQEDIRICVSFNDLTNPATVLTLLDECEADKALIAKLQTANAAQDDHINQQADRIESLEKTNHGLGKSLCSLEARTLTVTFDPIPMGELGNKNEGKTHPYMFGAGYNSAVVSCECALKRACAAAGIPLVVGGEDATNA